MKKEKLRLNSRQKLSYPECTIVIRFIFMNKNLSRNNNGVDNCIMVPFLRDQINSCQQPHQKDIRGRPPQMRSLPDGRRGGRCL